MQSPVERYAQATVRISHARALGREPDPADVREALSLEAWATANFDQNQIGVLGQMVAAKRAEYAQQLDAQAEGIQLHRTNEARATANALRTAMVRNTTRQMSHDGKGLTPAQLQQAHATGKYNVQRTRARDELHDRARQAGLNSAQADKVIASARKLLDDPKRLDKYLTQRFGDDLVERQRWVDAMETKLVEIGLRERMEKQELDRDPEAFKPVERKLSDADIRRLDILNELGRHGDEVLPLVQDRISEESLADTGLHGDVARAYAAHELTSRDEDTVADLIVNHDDGSLYEGIASEAG